MGRENGGHDMEGEWMDSTQISVELPGTAAGLEVGDEEEGVQGF